MIFLFWLNLLCSIWAPCKFPFLLWMNPSLYWLYFSMHKSYVLGFFEIALQTVISSTLYQRIPVGSTEQPLHLPLVTNQKNVKCRSCVRDAPCLATSRQWEPLKRNPLCMLPLLVPSQTAVILFTITRPFGPNCWSSVVLVWHDDGNILDTRESVACSYKNVPVVHFYIRSVVC